MHSVFTRAITPLTQRQHLVQLLKELNPTDYTTSDQFWMDLFHRFDGESMKELVRAIVKAKQDNLSSRLTMNVMPRTYQSEIFARLTGHPTNFIVFLPTGAGKTLVSFLFMKYMLEQYPEQHVVFLAMSVALAAQQHVAFFNIVQFPPELVTIFYGGKTAKSRNLKQFRVIFATPVVYQHMLDANQLKLHHCSLLVFDEVHHARKNHPYAVIMNDYVKQEHPLYRPRVLGMTASPGEGRNVDETLKAIQDLCATMQARLTTPTKEESVADLDACTTFQNTIVDVYEATSSDKSLIDVVVNYLKKCFRLCINLENQTLGAEENNVDRPYQFPPAPVRKSTASRTDLVKALELMYKTFEDGEAQFASGDPSVPDLFDLVHQLISCTTSDTQKQLLCGLVETWEAIEEIEDFGSSSANSTSRDLTMLIPDNTISKVRSQILRHFLAEWNQLKEGLGLELKRLVSGRDSGHGKMVPLMRHLTSMGEDSRAIVFVQERATAFKVTRYLQEHLPAGADCLVGKAEMTASRQLTAAQRFNEGQFKVLVATSVAEEGIDIKSCDLVVRLDGTMSSKALIQSRGRARHQSSRFVLIVGPEEQRHLLFQMKKEQFMKAAVRFEVDPKSLQRDGVDLEALFAEFSESSDATTTSPMDFQMLHQWHQQNYLRMPEFSFTDKIEPGPARFTATVVFKGQTFKGHGPQKKEAKFAAASAAYRSLFPATPKTYASTTASYASPLVPAGNASYASSLRSPSLRTSEIYSSSSEEEDDFGFISRSSPEETLVELTRGLNLSYRAPISPVPAPSYLPASYLSPLTSTVRQAPQPATQTWDYGASAPVSSASAYLSSSTRTGSQNARISVSRADVNSTNPIGRLQEICQGAGLAIPTYIDLGQDHYTAQFVASCTVLGVTAQGSGTQKKIAKTNAAYALLAKLAGVQQ